MRNLQVLTFNSPVEPPPPPLDYFYYAGQANPALGGIIANGNFSLTQIEIDGTPYVFFPPLPITIGAVSYDAVLDYAGVINPTLAPEFPDIIDSFHCSVYCYDTRVTFGIIGVVGKVINVSWEWTDIPYGGATINSGVTTLVNQYPYTPVSIVASVPPSAEIDVSGVTIPMPPAPAPTPATIADSAFQFGTYYNTPFTTGGGFSSAICDRLDSVGYQQSLLEYVQNQFGSQCGLTVSVTGASTCRVIVTNVPQGLCSLVGASIGIDYGCTGAYGVIPVTLTEV